MVASTNIAGGAIPIGEKTSEVFEDFGSLTGQNALQNIEHNCLEKIGTKAA